MRTTIAALSLLALLACGSGHELTAEEAYTVGRAAVDRAIQLYEEGRIRDSWREFREAEALASDYDRLSAGGGGTEDEQPRAPIRPPAPGGSLDPAAGTAARWRDEYRIPIELSWNVISDAVREETIDIALLKGFVSEYLGRAQIDRVNREYSSAEPILKARRAGQYWFDCEGHAEVCGIVFAALRQRIGAGSVTESWTGDRDDYLGIVDARVDVLESVTYRGGSTSAGGFPSKVAIRLEPKRKSGSDRWSQPFSTTFEGSPPSRIGRDEYGEVQRRHFEALSAHLGSELTDWPAGERAP
jgi:hypothetical protein